MKMRILSMALAIVMVLGMMPVSASAAGEPISVKIDGTPVALTSVENQKCLSENDNVASYSVVIPEGAESMYIECDEGSMNIRPDYSNDDICGGNPTYTVDLNQGYRVLCIYNYAHGTSCHLYLLNEGEKINPAPVEVIADGEKVQLTKNDEIFCNNGWLDNALVVSGKTSASEVTLNLLGEVAGADVYVCDASDEWLSDVEVNGGTAVISLPLPEGGDHLCIQMWGLFNEDQSFHLKLEKTAAAACTHTTTNTTYAQVEGTETHTVTVTCAKASCGKQISKTTADCVDADKNGSCDVCEGNVAVPEEEETSSMIAKLTDGTQLPVEQLEDVDDGTGMGTTIPCYQITVPEGMEMMAPLALTYDGEAIEEFYSWAMGGMAPVGYYPEVCYLMDMNNFTPYVAITFVEGDVTVAPEGGEEPECQHEETETTYTTVDGEKHTVTVTCTCGEKISEETVACVDADKNLKCDVCGGAVACKHTETTTTYAQVEGTETHTVTVTCSCGEQISQTTEACVDAGKDGQCDKCEGAVEVVLPAVIFDSSVDGGWGGSITIKKLMVEGVTVKGYEWKDGTCIVTLAEDTPKDATVTFSYEGLSGGGGSGAFYVAGNKNTRTAQLTNGEATVEVATASKFVYTTQQTKKTIKFQLEGTAFVPVERIEITNENPVVTANGGRLQLVVKVYPENATVQDITWSTSASSTAITLTADGMVLGQTMGMGQYYTVTATSKDNPNATASVKVFLDYKMETAIEISQQTMTLQVGETGTLSATVTADNFAGNKSVTWSSSDESIATVASGKVTGLKNGTVTITATSYHGLTATCVVTVEGGSDTCDHKDTTTNPVYKQVDGTETHTVTVLCQCGEQIGEVTTENCVDTDKDNKCDKCAGAVTNIVEVTKLTWWVKATKVTEVTVNVGDVVDAVTGCTPRNTAGNVVTYTSADPEIVSVNNAEAVADDYGHAYMSFTALKAGETTITATANEAKVEAILNVKVVDPNAPSQIDGVYQIATADNLLWFAEAVNGGETGISAVLTADIDLTGKTWAGIGTDTYSFAGSFDGQNKTVTFDNAANGLFARVLGTASKRAEIKNVITAGTITITESGNANVAAVVGKAQLANITNCVNNASITNHGNYTAGIVGYVDYKNGGVTIRNCVNNGAIWSDYAYVGGILGYGQSSKSTGNVVVIDNCFNTGAVTAQNHAGGIVGYITSSLDTAATVTNCYNSGTISTVPNENRGQSSGGIVRGGITGTIYKNVSVANCYNIGSVTYGLLGSVQSPNGQLSIVNSYYLDSASEYPMNGTPAVMTDCSAKTAAEMGSEEFAALLGEAYKVGCPAPVFTWQTAAEHSFVDGTCANCGAADSTAAPEKGDLDGDGELTAKDATEILKIVASGAEFVTLADMDGDGEITAKDATEILKVVAAGTT